MVLFYNQPEEQLVSTTAGTSSGVGIEEVPEEESERSDNNNANAPILFPYQDYGEFKAKMNAKLDAIFKTLKLLIEKHG